MNKNTVSKNIISKNTTNRSIYLPLSISLLSSITLLSGCSNSKTNGATSDKAVDSAMPMIVADVLPSESSPSQPQGQAGVVTAGEWNDLQHWDFWIQLIDNKEFWSKLEHWQLYPKHRVSLYLHDGKTPIRNATVELTKQKQQQDKNSAPIWTARTDNQGKAELWADFFDNSKHVEFKEYAIKVNGKLIDSNVYPYYQQITDINIRQTQPVAKKADIAFIVDATGSMQDEIDFLKRDLQSVIKTVKNNNTELDVETATVFYRDRSDQRNGDQEEYLVRKSDFDDLDSTMKFIQRQNADGGGDFPEAVDAALDTAINQLHWADNAHARLAFLLLDAPPHHTPEVLANLRQLITDASKKGIKIIPISASGIDKETEFLMRALAMSTNGTYTFITDDSGVGNPHLVASVGDYEVEKLNALIVRLIEENTKF